ncbi:uncharacterized protein LOC109851766 isoform X2 [Pseudomyrmex gracilis]|uniref:uncharacterized protein LOC109851766 isoform X2 n=1 Tax=Pseudomyrmex gracilis TaxID=219809 RepID=UPI000995D205|nr:uncharacterized protein LOC109851766 isoform X2 [Pseudomyrmex gracilis]
MFICSYCSLAFATEGVLNFHVKKCRKITEGIKSSQAESGPEDFLTSANKIFSNILEICEYCYQNFDTSEELVAHRTICIIKNVHCMLDKLAKIDLTRSGKQPAKILTPSSSLSTSSDHSEQKSNKERNLSSFADLYHAIDCALMPPPTTSVSKELSVQKYSKKRLFDTSDTDRSNKCNVNLELTSPPKIFRFDDKNQKKIEKNDTEQEIAADNICHIATSVLKLAPCEYCSVSFETEAELLAHSKICDAKNNPYTKCFKKNDQQFWCPDCGNLFWTIHKLATHKTFYCEKKSQRQLKAIGKWNKL